MQNKVSLLAPLKNIDFRQLFFANFFSNIGNWIQIFTTGLVVASLSRNPAIAALSQTATQLPIFILAILGGVLAHKINISRFQFIVNSGMALIACFFVLIASIGLKMPYAYLLLTLFISSFGALLVPARQSQMSSFVPNDQIEASATLNGLSNNLASVIGPILASFAFACGIPTLYALNVLSFVYSIYIFFMMSRRPIITKVKISLSGSLIEGIRAAIGSKAFIQHALFAVVIFIPISGYNALLPIFVVEQGGGSDTTLATMMSCFGVGAVISAFLIQKIRHLVNRNVIIAVCLTILGVFYIIVSNGLFNLHTYLWCAIGGIAWASIISTMNSHTQRMFHTELRSRLIGIYMTVFYGALTFGSALCGGAAKQFGIETVLYVLGIVLILIGATTIVFNRCEVI
ncbi:MAG: MFS transporter [Burkholderiales bacterium]|nr:MFS transporter [Burkholderiales bacterium]